MKPDQIKPKNRAGHTITLIHVDFNHSLVHYALFGGWDGSLNNGTEIGAENDLWILTLNTDTYQCVWKEYVLPNPPIARDCHTAVHSSGNKYLNYLIIYGGSDPDFNYLSHLSICNLDGLVEPPPLTSLITRSYLIKRDYTTAEEFLQVYLSLPISIRDFLYSDLNFISKSDQENTSIITRSMELYCQFVKLFSRENTQVEFIDLNYQSLFTDSSPTSPDTPPLHYQQQLMLSLIETNQSE